ncbi:MAG: GNAT family N-acetyltransferase [Burkholderiaceae bacterium]
MKPMPPEDWTLRPATEGDRPFLLALRLATMAPHFERQGCPIDLDEHRRRADHRFDVARIVVREGRAIGLLKLVREGDPWQVEQIQLAPAAQGQGLGAAILHAVVDQARAAGVGLELSVLKANPARRLYERLGFVVCDEDDHSYTMRRAP